MLHSFLEEGKERGGSEGKEGEEGKVGSFFTKDEIGEVEVTCWVEGG